MYIFSKSDSIGLYNKCRTLQSKVEVFGMQVVVPQAAIEHLMTVPARAMEMLDLILMP